MSKIETIQAYEVLDSRGNPTVAAVVTTQKTQARAMVPSGASTGVHEAVELRDGDAKRYGGKGVLKACENVQTVLADALVGKEVGDVAAIDAAMIELDGTPNKSKLGANAILAVSLACARTAAQESEIPLYRYLREIFGGEQGDAASLRSAVGGGLSGTTLPVPMMNVLNGGKHADSGLDIQEFMIVPAGARTFAQALQMGAEVFHALGALLKADGQVTTVGDEGGYAPKLSKQEDAMEYILRATEKAGYAAGKDVFIALDPAASEFYTASGGENGTYLFSVNGKKEQLSSDDMIAFWKGWKEKYPIVSIEDGLAEDDWAAWSKMTAEMGGASGGDGGLQIVGDDLLVTNTERLQKGIQAKAANSILIKVNQIGSLTEAAAAIAMARKAGWTSVVSHRSGETEDTFIADLAVGCETGQIKTGSLSRSERVAKYNRLLEIERELVDQAVYPGVSVFHKT